MTTGITTCDGGDNFDPGDVFGAGKDQWCPLLPPEWDPSGRVPTPPTESTVYLHGARASTPRISLA